MTETVGARVVGNTGGAVPEEVTVGDKVVGRTGGEVTATVGATVDTGTGSGVGDGVAANVGGTVGADVVASLFLSTFLFACSPLLRVDNPLGAIVVLTKDECNTGSRGYQ